MVQRTLRKRTLEEVLRYLDDTVHRLLTRTSYTIGTAPNAYVIEVNAAGQLIARHTTTLTVTVLALP